METGSRPMSGDSSVTSLPGPIRIPAPLPPDDPAAWYAPSVRRQLTVHPGVVTTIYELDDGFAYDTREPTLSERGERARDRIREYFEAASLQRPRTREGVVEVVTEGFAEKHRIAIDRLTELGPERGRRVRYWALRDHRCLGALTALALDESIEVADVTDGELVVHTERFAPARTDIQPEKRIVRRFASERVANYTVPFHGESIPVVIYREHLLGEDPFAVRYAVQEPDLLPGDRKLIAECRRRLWESGVDTVVEDRTEFVRERAGRFLSRRLTARNTRAWLDATRYRLRTALAEYGLAVPPADERYAGDRLADLVYYVLRDYVAEGELSVPLRDPHLEDIEANRVGERIKVVPRASVGHGGRIPTNLSFDSESAFVNVVTQLAAADGVELNAATPSAKVNLDLDDVAADITVRCAVALPAISEDGPHVSIRKQAPDALTPVDLMQRDAISADLVTLLWLAYEYRGVVLFSGPTGVGKTTLMNAHMPFIPFDDRPISIDEGSREVSLPHETGVSLTTRDHQHEFKRVTMAQLMTETNYLNPDLEVIAEINTRESFETFAETLNTGHGVIGTTHAEDLETLVNRVIEQGLPAYLLRELDLVVFPKQVASDRYVGTVVEIVDEIPDTDSSDNSKVTAVRSESEADRTEEATAHEPTPAGQPDPPASETLGGDLRTLTVDETTIGFRVVAKRSSEGDFAFVGANQLTFLRRLADRTDREPSAVISEFHRKRRYVEYLRREGITGLDELFSLLSDLRTNEAATVERLATDIGDNDRPTITGQLAAVQDHQ